MLVRRKSACKASAGSSKIFLAGPTFGSKSGPKTGPKQDLKEGMKMWSNSGPHFFGVHIWTQKWGQPSENFVAFFFGRRPLPFGGSPLEAYPWTSGESNLHRRQERRPTNWAAGTPIGEFRCCPQMFCKQICDPAAEHECQHIPFSLCASQGRLLLYKKQIGTRREKACVNTYAASASQICLQNICGQQQNFSMAGPTFGSKSGPQNGAHAKTEKKEWKCDPILDPILGSIFGPKNGVSYRRISLLPQMFCKQICDPAAWTWMSTHTFFSLCVPRPLATVQETNWDVQREKACVWRGCCFFPLRKCIFSVAATFWVAKLDSLLLVFFLPRPVFFLPRTGFFPPRTVFSRCLQNAFFLLQRCFCAAARCFFCCFEFFPLRSGIFCWRFSRCGNSFFPLQGVFFLLLNVFFSVPMFFFCCEPVFFARCANTRS